MNFDAFLEQADAYEDEDDLFSRQARFWSELSLTHPVAVRRVKELTAWVRSGDFDLIMSGEYVRRGSKSPPLARSMLPSRTTGTASQGFSSEPRAASKVSANSWAIGSSAFRGRTTRSLGRNPKSPEPAPWDTFGSMVFEMRVGAVNIEGVSDGSLLVPPGSLFNKNDQDWLPHSQFPDPNGMLPIKIGGFLVRSGERLVLVDTGIGPGSTSDRTGMFMRSLSAIGVHPAEVADVVLTHLHFDHLGWATDGERRLFDRAIYRC